MSASQTTMDKLYGMRSVSYTHLVILIDRRISGEWD